jgi:hypothetical protein
MTSGLANIELIDKKMRKAYTTKLVILKKIT